MWAKVPGLGVGGPHTHPQDEGQLRLAPRVLTAPWRASDASTRDEDTDTEGRNLPRATAGSAELGLHPARLALRSF